MARHAGKREDEKTGVESLSSDRDDPSDSWFEAVDDVFEKIAPLLSLRSLALTWPLTDLLTKSSFGR